MALSRSFYALGVVLRETGQAMDRLGCLVMGNMAPAEQCKLPSNRSLQSVEVVCICSGEISHGGGAWKRNE